MIPNQKVKVVLKARAKKRFAGLGYDFSDVEPESEVEIEVRHLPSSSRVRVEYECDRCCKSGHSMYFSLVEKKEHVCRSCARMGKAPANKVELDARRARKIVAASKRGKGAPEIGQSLGISPVVVRRVLKAHGISGRAPNKLNSRDEAKVAKLYRSGESMPTIAERFGVSKQPIRAALLRQGVKLRTTSEAAKGRPAHNRDEFSPSEIRKIRRAWEHERITAEEIAERLGRQSATPIYRVIHEQGFTKETDAAIRRKQERRLIKETSARWKGGESEAAEACYTAGLNFAEVSHELEMHAKTLSALMTEAGYSNDGALISLDIRESLLSKYGKRKGGRAADLAKRYGLKKQVVLNFLTSRGIDTGNAFGITEHDAARCMDWYEQGLGTPEIAFMLSEEKNAHIKSYTISKLLTDRGVQLGLYVLSMDHIPTCDKSQTLRLRGGWEKDVARYLDQLVESGAVTRWEYESLQIPYADEGESRTYVPDFIVYRPDGSTEIWEVKGNWFPGTDAKILAAEAAGYDVRVIHQGNIAKEIWPHVISPNWTWSHSPQGERWDGKTGKPAQKKGLSRVQRTMVEQIANVGYMLGHTPSMREFDAAELGRSSKEVTAAFEGGWNDVILMAGLLPNRKNDWTRDQLAYYLSKLHRRLGGQPRQEDLGSRNGTPAYGTYANAFGSLESALSYAGISLETARPRHDHLTDAQLLEALRELKIRLGRPPGRRVLEFIKSFPSEGIYKKRFGSFSEALEAAEIVSVRRKFRAKDGCLCDSASERTVDDFLSSHKIKHETHPLYPSHPELNPRGSLIADWRLKNGTWVEYFGVTNNKKYEARKKQKQKLAKAVDIRLVSLTVEDLDPLILKRLLL